MIYADDRENEALLHRLFLAAGNRKTDPKGDILVKRLNYGDYVIGDWVIEAKEINDLYRTILGIGRNGRNITHQLQELCDTSDKPFLAIYGTQLKPYFKGRKARANEMSREIAKMNHVIKSFKMTVYSHFPNIRVIEFATMDDFVQWLTIAHLKKKMKQSLTVANRTKTPTDDPRLLALMGVQGITEEIAGNLLLEYGSIPNLLKTKVKIKDLMAIRGIGRVTARRLKDLRKQWQV
jgi:ERCC4-type nuclease